MKQKFIKQYSILGLDEAIEHEPPRKKADIIFGAACKVMGFNPDSLPVVDHLGKAFRVSIAAFYKLQVVRQAIVGPWIADWNREDQPKWYPWFYMNKPGFRLDDFGYGWASTHSGVGSRLCCETEEQAYFLGEDCISLWADYMGTYLPGEEVPQP